MIEKCPNLAQFFEPFFYSQNSAGEFWVVNFLTQDLLNITYSEKTSSKITFSYQRLGLIDFEISAVNKTFCILLNILIECLEFWKVKSQDEFNWQLKELYSKRSIAVRIKTEMPIRPA